MRTQIIHDMICALHEHLGIDKSNVMDDRLDSSHPRSQLSKSHKYPSPPIDSIEFASKLFPGKLGTSIGRSSLFWFIDYTNDRLERISLPLAQASTHLWILFDLPIKTRTISARVPLSVLWTSVGLSLLPSFWVLMDALGKMSHRTKNRWRGALLFPHSKPSDQLLNARPRFVPPLRWRRMAVAWLPFVAPARIGMSPVPPRPHGPCRNETPTQGNKLASRGGNWTNPLFLRVFLGNREVYLKSNFSAHISLEYAWNIVGLFIHYSGVS
jgi:hypothetical protein